MVEVAHQESVRQLLARLRREGVPGGSGSGWDATVALARLIYVRWVDFQEAEQEAIAAFDDVEYEPVLPASLHWRTWHDLPPVELSQFLQERLPAALHDLGNARHSPLATNLHRLYHPALPEIQLPADVVAAMVHWLADQPFETPTTADAFSKPLTRSWKPSARSRQASTGLRPRSLGCSSPWHRRPPDNESMIHVLARRDS